MSNESTMFASGFSNEQFYLSVNISSHVWDVESWIKSAQQGGMDSGKLETVPTGTVHLDTVRALHQTVVSLRTALEFSKNELKELKEKYQQHSHCIEYTDVIEKLTLENHILRRKIINSGIDEQDAERDVKLRVTYSPQQKHFEKYTSSEVVVRSAIDSKSSEENSEVHLVEQDSNNFCTTKKLNEIEEEKFESLEQGVTENNSLINNPESGEDRTEVEEIVSLIASNSSDGLKKRDHPSFNTKLELLSKFDVRIKVRTLKEGAVISSTTSDTDSTVGDKKDSGKEGNKASYNFEEKREHFNNTEDVHGNKINFRTISTDNIKMAVPNESEVKNKVDKFDVQVRITSEENLVVKENLERNRKRDTLNLDVDNLSLRSMSEGDNSVFSDTGIPPTGQDAASNDDKQEHGNASGNESEEVDDIELIFTTDESKDMSNLQEDLVPIRETEQWCPNSASTTHSTPVLIKFHTLDPDFPSKGEMNDEETTNIRSVITESSLRMKRVSLPSDKEIRNSAFTTKGSLDLPGRGILKNYENKSDYMLYRKSPNVSTRKLDSVDSLTADYKGLSFDNTKSSSFELGSSMDILHRDESMDNFHKNAHLGHRFSIFAETDISKCGISEDDLSGNLNVRRNTCPNPFQYRSPPYRSARPAASGPVKAPLGRARGGREGLPAQRRESGAQTDMSALPPRWSSDGYLAYKCAVPARSIVRRPTVPAVPAPAQPRADEPRRLLLSDIGFTSMVPELSRSADPLYAIGRRAPPPEGETTHTAKYMSRTSYRSPSHSVDRSSEWTPQTIYVPNREGRGYRPWRSWTDVRRDDTEDLLDEADAFLRRSIDNLHYEDITLPSADKPSGITGRPYIPAEPRHLRLGHAVKVITPHGRIAVGRVRYVGVAGGSAARSGVVVGAEFAHAQHPGLARNSGTLAGRRYFLAHADHTALFVPFSKVVMAWAN